MARGGKFTEDAKNRRGLGGLVSALRSALRACPFVTIAKNLSDFAHLETPTRFVSGGSGGVSRERATQQQAKITKCATNSSLCHYQASRALFTVQVKKSEPRILVMR